MSAAFQCRFPHYNVPLQALIAQHQLRRVLVLGPKFSDSEGSVLHIPIV
jgi:hypothetical protein